MKNFCDDAFTSERGVSYSTDDVDVNESESGGISTDATFDDFIRCHFKREKNWEALRSHEMDGNVYTQKDANFLSSTAHLTREDLSLDMQSSGVTFDPKFHDDAGSLMVQKRSRPRPEADHSSCQISNLGPVLRCRVSDEMQRTFEGSLSQVRLDFFTSFFWKNGLWQMTPTDHNHITKLPLKSPLSNPTEYHRYLRPFGDAIRSLQRARVKTGQNIAKDVGSMRAVYLLCFFLLSATILPTAAQDVIVSSLRDVWLTASGSSDYYRGQNPCNSTDFLGVTCTNSTVTGLSLTGRNLNGMLSPSIGNLTNLTSLSITLTQLNGQIPSTIGQLQNLISLQLANSNFSGPLPSSMGNLTNLQKLDLSYNYRLNGSIDVLQSCTNLTSIGTNINNFTGEIPPFVFNSSITFAQLGYNQFTYPPNVIFPSPSKLTSLYLGGMASLGNLPSYLYGNLTSVTTLSVDINDITALQDSFASAFPNVTNLNLAYNPLTSIPSLITMNNLTTINLYNSYNLRNITSVLVNLPQSITYLNLDNTNINGILDGMSSLLPNLNTLIMNNVRLSGDLSGLTSLYKLTTLSMQSAFQGSIANRTLPASFGSLSQLMTVDLSVRLSDVMSVLTGSEQSNRLVGGVPPSLSQLQALVTLNLRSNYLNGSVPSFMNASTFPSLTSIDLSNNQFALIEENALSGFTFKCSVVNNPFSCFTAQPLNSICLISVNTTCPLQLLYSAEISISSNDAQDILRRYSSAGQTTDQNIDVISAVVTALLRSTKTFSYTSDSVSLSLQTYSKNESSSDAIENVINGRTCSVRLPLSSVLAYDQVSVALSFQLSSSLLSVYNESIGGKMVGVQVYDGNGREVEIQGVTEKINITMGYIDDIPSDHTAVCQWWNETQRVWSRDGCDLYIDEARLAVCQCSHLTNFSIGIIAANTRNIPADGGGMSTKTLIIIICCAAGGAILILSIIAILLVMRNRRGTKGETMISMTSGEEMKGRVKMERKEREEEGIETWKAECDGVTAVCVMKAVNARGKSELTREAVMLQRQHHPMIVMYLGQDSAEGYIVTEWMNAGRLQEYVRGEELDLYRLLKIGEDVAKGMTYIHEQGLVHTHLTAKSVFLSVIDGEVTAKIANMRHAVTEGDRAEQRQMGPHTAPEVGREGVYKKASDVYSYGLLLWWMVEQEDISEQTGQRLATRESSAMTTKSWDTGMKALVLGCTQTQDRPKFFDIAKKMRARRQTVSANIKSEEDRIRNHNDSQAGDSYAHL
ncbi:putative leucine-rich repeat receptor-like protein kinase [Planoprotostelium fungivorum]|uniref:Putative leucine-rich repeat receptor-like protein kinase n=1 Tax=Planoprotostelium fungivorum TaxID=1890364 RepID=A0A2P6MXW4_9EUKA|nr:putative leucine-rich repeat receptor-like protein kinase [Planoprotostelium fungivorum]